MKIPSGGILAATAWAVIAASAVAAPFNYEVRIPVSPEVLKPISIDLLGFSLPAATIGQPYSFDFKSPTTLSVSGGGSSPVFLWSLTGALPPGLALNAATGIVSGTPTTKNKTGTSFDLQAAAGTKSDVQGYTIVVNGVPLKVSQISVGEYNVCALTLAGGVKCWGDDSYGALGNGAVSGPQVAPGDVVGLTSGVIRVASGQNHTCALLAAGTVKCWGRGSNGQLGNGTTADSQVPVNVTGLSGVVTIAAGYLHTCAVVTGGAVKCWGHDGYGQIGNGGGNDGNLSSPVSVTTASGAIKLGLGEVHSCAILDTGALQCWGSNEFGKLGVGDSVNRYAPADVVGLTSGVTDVDGSYSFTCAIQNGTAKCWGSTGGGKLGSNLPGGSQTTPIDVTGLGNASSISTGGEHACAVTTAGAMKCWGRNAVGELGVGSTADFFAYTPTDVPGLSSNVTGADLGVQLSCAIHDDAAKCWGWDYYGQIGDGGTESNQPSPVTLEQN